MRLPLEWIEEILPLPASVEEVAERLALAGLEIESMEPSAVPPGVVAGRIVECDRIEGSDLHHCRVDAAVGELVPIVCGAPEVAVGMLVPLALPGALLGGRRVEIATIRGFESRGMFCSERDLGLGDGHEGILQLSPDEGFAAGTVLRDRLIDTTVLDFAITPNRGDCASVLGVAREMAALWRLGFRDAPATIGEAGLSDAGWEAGIDAEDGCRGYTLRAFESRGGAAIAPLRMRRRLHQAGVRSISPIVDVTNFVMLERGQPLHAFDAERLTGTRIVARWARSGENLTLLDGGEVALGSEDLVIADASGPVALAGVMGGARSEVHGGTRRLLLESASFEPGAVRRTARRAGRSTEASFRFERGVDPSGAVRASARAAELLATMGLAPTSRLVAASTRERSRPTISVAVPALGRLLGINCDQSRIFACLEAVGAEVKVDIDSRLAVTPPTWRFDLNLPADMAEEVARLEGYDSVPETLPRIAARAGAGRPDPIEVLRGALRAHGLAEVLPLAFVAAAQNTTFCGIFPEGSGAVAVLNPISSETGELRRSMLPGMLATVELNRSRGMEFVPIFAIGQIFSRDEGSGDPMERRSLGLVVAGTPPGEFGRRPVALGLPQVRGIVEDVLRHVGVRDSIWRASTAPGFHPGRCATISRGDVVLGIGGELDPRAALAREIDPGPVWMVELDVARVLVAGSGTRRHATLARFPAVRRDAALVVRGDLPAADLLAAFAAARTQIPLAEGVEVFDEYVGPGIPEGCKSLAVSISYRSTERTLTDQEVVSAHEKLLEAVQRRVHFERR